MSEINKLERLNRLFLENKKELRVGQSLMNALAHTDFDAYKAISGSEINCYYRDELFLLTIKEIYRIWDMEGIDK